MVYEFAIAGEPVPQGSMRHVGGGRLIHSKNLIVWRKKVAAHVRSVSDVSIDGPVIIDVLFCLSKPKTVKRDLPTVAPDLDKLQRAIGDALSVDCDFLKDDAQVVEWHSRKIYGDAGVIIRIITT
jgi:Holliday junction resolvase RusA-like endonuclease